MASVDYTYFTDADMPQKNMKDWHTCLKAKQISLFFLLFFYLLLLTLSVCLFVSVCSSTSLFVWRTWSLPPIWMYVCIYVHILYKYIMRLCYGCLQKRVLSLTCSLTVSLSLRVADSFSFALISVKPLLLLNLHVALRPLQDPSICHTTINFTRKCPISQSAEPAELCFPPAFSSDIKD